MPGDRKTRLLALVLFVGAAQLTGCDAFVDALYGPPLPSPPLEVGDAAAWVVELGSGEDFFSPLPEGGTIPRGTAGSGQGPSTRHLAFALRLRDAPVALRVQTEVWREGRLVVRAIGEFTSVPESTLRDAGSPYELPPWEPAPEPAGSEPRVILDIRATAEGFLPGPVVVKLTLVDPQTRLFVTLERNVVVT